MTMASAPVLPAAQRPSTTATLVRFATAVVVLLMGIVSLHVLVSVLNLKINKPHTPLRGAALTAGEYTKLLRVSKELGLPLRYEAKGADLNMPADQIQTLGTADYLLRDYDDVAAGPAGEKAVRLNVNYYGTGTGSVHVPDICWTASGRVRNMAVGDRVIVIKGVKFPNGAVSDVPVRLIAFDPTPDDIRRNPDWKGQEDKHLLCVAYTFNVNGEYVSSRHEVMQRFWNLGLPFAYHAKIEAKVNRACSADEAAPIVEAFLREAIPEVAVVLPDRDELLGQGKPAPVPPAGTPLREALSGLDHVLGQPAKYESAGEAALDAETVNNIGTPDYLFRPYANLRYPRVKPGESRPEAVDAAFLVNVNYYGVEWSKKIPDTWFTATDAHMAARGAPRDITVKGVARPDGSVGDLPIRVQNFGLSGEDRMFRSQWVAKEDEHLLTVASTIVYPGGFSSSSADVRKQLNVPGAPVTYYARIEVRVVNRGTAAAGEKAVEDFLRELVPAVTRILPSAPAPAPATAPAAGIRHEPARSLSASSNVSIRPQGRD